MRSPKSLLIVEPIHQAYPMTPQTYSRALPRLAVRAGAESRGWSGGRVAHLGWSELDLPAGLAETHFN